MPSRTDTLGREVNEAVDRLIRRASLPRVRQRLNAAAGVDLDRSSYWLANLLADSTGLRLSELAELLHTDLSTISRQVQAAERAGLVQRQPDPSDGRASLVSLTRTGRTALDRIGGLQRAEMLAAMQDWSTEEQRIFARLLGRFSSAFLVWATDEDLPEREERVPARKRVTTRGTRALRA